jgi:glycosyltransferase involved in cell wall biosynthesis
MINDFYQSHESFKMPNYNLINKVRDKKIFFMCTHPNQGTGYARVANKLTNYLVKHYDLTYFAFQNFPNQDVKDRFIDPKIKIIDAVKEDPISPKGFGDKAIISSFENEKPDILFLYNDLPVCVSILKLLEDCNHTNYKVILYLDLVYRWEDIERIEYLKTKADFCFVFLKCWKDHLVEDYLWNPQKIAVLPHGIDTNDFKKLDSKNSKKELGLQEDDFIVLNMNRNSYRKQWYLTIQAFIIFLRKTNLNPRVKLFCSCLIFTEDGFDITKLIRTECLKHGLDSQQILDNHIFHNPTAFFSSEEKVNLIYNACDVGINTCCGEGFGLTNLEHGILGKPQIVSGVPALQETLRDHGIIINPTQRMTISNFESHGGEICIFNPYDFAEQLFNIFKFYTESTNLKTHIENNYNWENVYKTLDFVMTTHS